MKRNKIFLWLALAATIFSMASGVSIPSKEDSSTNSYLPQIRNTLFKIAAHWTDPICKTHEYFRRFHIEEQLHPTSFRISDIGRKCLLFVQGAEKLRQSIISTFPAMAIRALAVNLQEEPFIHFHEEENPVKELPENGTFTLFSWNVCFVGAGFPISDGGVLPWSSRIDPVIDKIIEQNADVNCLYETFDTSSAFHIYERLKKAGYSHFYFNIGPKAVGASSGIFVASKYSIANPEFTPFSLDSLVGRTKNVEKGVFAFDLQSKGKNFARIFATHLQHSEQPAFSTTEEQVSREKQMEVILSKISQEKDKCIVLTGDLNLDDEEYNASSWQNQFKKAKIPSDSLMTWGGDGYCAQIMGKPISGPLNLDHTLLTQESKAIIRTTLIDVGFDGTVFRKEALSDHLGLFNEIILRPVNLCELD